MSRIKEFFQILVKAGAIPQEPMNYDAATLKIYIDHLESENAALRERLEKAVELPCNVGDTIYSVFEFPKEKTVLKGTCNHIDINICGGFPEIFTKCVFETNEMILPRIYSGKALNNIFLTKQEAEARLAELKGGGGK